MIHLQDKVAIVTGASRGIGEAIARAYVEAGAKVMLASRKAEGLEAVAKTLPPDRAAFRAAHAGKRVDHRVDSVVPRRQAFADATRPRGEPGAQLRVADDAVERRCHRRQITGLHEAGMSR